jgi:glycosyltransferase involved in cell wall biosynthesis
MTITSPVRQPSLRDPEPDVTLSLVIPLYQEEDNVDPVLEELLSVLDKLPESAEVILVDDGSSDATGARVLPWTERDGRVRFLQLRRNFGQTAAIAAGIKQSTGRVIVLMDGDAQNDPHDIPCLLAKIGDGFDVVSGWRRDRKDKLLLRRFPSKVANALISRVTKTRLHDYGCTLKAYNGEVLRELVLYGDMHRFIPALASVVGARVTEVPVNHRPRTRGKSKYGLSRTIRVLLDLLTVKFMERYLHRPMQLFGTLGLGCFGLGLCTVLYLTATKLAFGSALANRPLLILASALTIIGIQFFCIGLLGELMTRLRHESGHRPYVIRRTVVLGQNGATLNHEVLAGNMVAPDSLDEMRTAAP